MKKNVLLIREIVREKLGLRRVRRRPDGPRIRKMAELAIIYWKAWRIVDWYDGGIKVRVDRFFEE